MHVVEYALVCVIRALFRAFPVDMTSNLTGILARTIGPRLGYSRRVHRNLDHVCPGIPAADRKKIVAGTWDTIGRAANDYCQLTQISREAAQRVEIIGGEHLDAIRDSNRGSILFSAHLGFWEAIPLAARQHRLPLSFMSRRMNNQLLYNVMERWQSVTGATNVPTDRDGVRTLASTLKKGGHVLLLADVRLQRGISVPFLGRDAMTPSAPATLCRKYGAALVPVRTERISASRYRVTVEEPRLVPDSGDRSTDILATMTWVNERIEEWIRERPEQWFWLHRRWGKDLPQSDGD